MQHGYLRTEFSKMTVQKLTLSFILVIVARYAKNTNPFNK